MKKSELKQIIREVIYGIHNEKINEYEGDNGEEKNNSPTLYHIINNKTKKLSISNLNKFNIDSYDLGGAETDQYSDDSKVVIVDNYNIDEYIDNNGPIKDKLFINFNLNKYYNFPKVKKIIIVNTVFHLSNIENIAKTINDSLLTGGIIEYGSDFSDNKGIEFLDILKNKYKFYIIKITKTSPGELLILSKTKPEKELQSIFFNKNKLKPKKLKTKKLISLNSHKTFGDYDKYNNDYNIITDIKDFLRFTKDIKNIDIMNYDLKSASLPSFIFKVGENDKKIIKNIEKIIKSKFSQIKIDINYPIEGTYGGFIKYNDTPYFQFPIKNIENIEITMLI
jgi:hypothetical protein